MGKQEKLRAEFEYALKELELNHQAAIATITVMGVAIIGILTFIPSIISGDSVSLTAALGLFIIIMHLANKRTETLKDRKYFNNKITELINKM